MNRHRRAPALFLLVFCAAFAGAQTPAAGTPKAAVSDSYVSDTLGFSIQPPAAGAESGSDIRPVASFFLPVENGFAGNVNVQRQRYGESLDAYMKLSLAQFRAAGFTIISQARKGNELRIEYSGRMKEVDLHWYARAVPAPPYVYLITATARQTSWPAQKQALMRSVDSFVLKAKP